jgi:uncharacterized protein (TIGR03437 family)
MQRRTALLPLCLFIVSAVAQPAFRTYAPPILNSASYMSPGMPGSAIAQGSIFAIFGSGFGSNDSYSLTTSYPLLKTLGGVSVKVTVGSTSVDAYPLAVIYGFQINALLQSSTPAGSGTLTVSYGGQSASTPIQVVPTAFGLYAANSAADGQASATDAAGNANSIINTFHPGDTVSLWGTGLGPVSWDETQPPTAGDLANSLPVATQVYVGSTSVAAGYHGRASCCSGLDRIDFVVPAGVGGCYVPVAVQAAGATSNIATIAVSNSGSTCGDSPLGQDLVNKLASGQTVNFGYIRLEAGSYNSADGGYATFNQFTPATASLASYAPSVGYCVAVDCTHGCQTNGNESLADLTEAWYIGVDAGPGINVQGEAGNAVIQQQYLGDYYNYDLGNGRRFLFASPPPYTVSDTTGGTNIGPFSATISVSGSASAFSNIFRYQTIPRNSDLTVKWDPSTFEQPNGLATIAAYSESEGDQDLGLLQCTAPVAAGQFTIPAWVLSRLPVTGLNGGSTGTGAMWLGQYDPPVTFSATGLDLGILTDITFYWVGVSFQ